MKLYIKLPFLLILATTLIVGCSNDEEDEGQTVEEENNNQETNETQEEETEENNGISENSSDNSEEEISDTNDNNDSNDTHIEHQEGLKMGETGIVVDNSENRYEVTLNSIEFVDTIGDSEPQGDIYAVADMTVKNIGDNSFNANNIYEPSFGPEGGDDGLQPSFNRLFEGDENVDYELLDGEIAPEESVTGVHIFNAYKGDNYRFIIGGSGHQIITYANWDIPSSEIEG